MKKVDESKVGVVLPVRDWAHALRRHEAGISAESGGAVRPAFGVGGQPVASRIKLLSQLSLRDFEPPKLKDASRDPALTYTPPWTHNYGLGSRAKQ